MKVEVTKQRMPYGLKYRAIGERFDVPDHAARALISIGLVKEAEGGAAPAAKRRARRTYRRRDMQPEPATAEIVVPEEAAEAAAVQAEDISEAAEADQTAEEPGSSGESAEQ